MSKNNIYYKNSRGDIFIGDNKIRRFTRDEYNLMRKTASRYGMKLKSKSELQEIPLTPEGMKDLKEQIYFRESMSTLMPNKNYSEYDYKRRTQFKENLFDILKNMGIDDHELVAKLVHINVDIDLAQNIRGLVLDYRDIFHSRKGKDMGVSYYIGKVSGDFFRTFKDEEAELQYNTHIGVLEGELKETVQRLEELYREEELYDEFYIKHYVKGNKKLGRK